jgi:hypothetical protein
MSRTKKGAKGPGYEYWSHRPVKVKFPSPGRETKAVTHRQERAAARNEVIDTPPVDPCDNCRHEGVSCLRCHYSTYRRL